MTRWLVPYIVENCFYNGTVQIKTIDEEGIPLLVNGHILKLYKKPFSKSEFINSVRREVYVMEKSIVSHTSWKKKIIKIHGWKPLWGTQGKLVGWKPRWRQLTCSKKKREKEEKGINIHGWKPLWGTQGKFVGWKPPWRQPTFLKKQKQKQKTKKLQLHLCVCCFAGY